MSGFSIRVALASDQRIFVESLAARLRAEDALDIVHVDAGERLFAASICRSEPEAVVICVDSGSGPLFDLAAEFREDNRSTKLVFLTSCSSDLSIAQALRLKASALLVKSEPVESLIAAIRRSVSGMVTFSDEVRERLQFDQGKQRYRLDRTTCLNGMTDRQLQVLRHLAHGDSVKEVARKLHLSPKSVNSHKYRIMLKIGVNDRVHLTRFAIREGLIHP